MVRVALIGTGVIAVQNHFPGIRMHPAGEVTALCDSNPEALAHASHAVGAGFPGLSEVRLHQGYGETSPELDERRRVEGSRLSTYTDYQALLAREEIDAVVIATPNSLHAPIALAAMHAGKHVLCEKPLGMSHDETEAMVSAAERAGVVNMTAFTYRFVPAIRWMKRLVSEGMLGTPYHFRVHRLQDWGRRALGWRQRKALSGSGELGDMLAHRIDYAHHLIGPITRLVAHSKQCLVERQHADGSVEPSDVEDWVAVIAELRGGVTAVFESTKMATGRGSGADSEDYVEINGSDATLVYRLEHPHELLIGRPGGRLERAAVPDELLKIPGASRDPRGGDPLQDFRYDQGFEFVQAIVEGRPASPDFRDGSRVQAVLDAVLVSAAEQRWVEVAIHDS